MPELPTVAIVSPKDPSQRWLINEADFHPSRYTRWEDREAVHEQEKNHEEAQPHEEEVVDSARSRRKTR